MRNLKFMASFAVAGLASVAFAGGTHVESGDAGDLLGSAQATGAGGALSFITGSTGGADFIDLYMIEVVDPVAFFASTAGDQGAPGSGSADFDTKLWLFDADGFGVVSNDDFGGSPFHSHLTGFADDGTGAAVKAGIYYLAVGGFGDEALSAGGEIFANGTFEEISGPDGPGGGSPLSGWANTGAQGNYNVNLQGVNAIPAPGAIALLGLAGLAGRRRRN